MLGNTQLRWKAMAMTVVLAALVLTACPSPPPDGGNGNGGNGGGGAIVGTWDVTISGHSTGYDSDGHFTDWPYTNDSVWTFREGGTVEITVFQWYGCSDSSTASYTFNGSTGTINGTWSFSYPGNPNCDMDMTDNGTATGTINYSSSTDRISGNYTTDASGTDAYGDPWAETNVGTYSGTRSGGFMAKE